MIDVPWKLDAELRSILVCPACRGELDDVVEGLCCPTCALLYPVVDNIPNLLAEEAKPYPPPPKC
jgi:uncharacterized protein